MPALNVYRVRVIGRGQPGRLDKLGQVKARDEAKALQLA
jgi:hypothetical protein